MTRFFRSLEIGDRGFGWAVLLMFAAFLAHKPALRLYDDYTTRQPWFDLVFNVPDHKAGGLPMVVYRKVVNRVVHGYWTVRIFSEPDAPPYLCTGTGFAYFQPEISGLVVVPLETFVGAACTPPPGIYQICAFYDLVDMGSERRSFGPFCDRFEVVNPVVN